MKYDLVTRKMQPISPNGNDGNDNDKTSKVA